MSLVRDWQVAVADMSRFVFFETQISNIVDIGENWVHFHHIMVEQSTSLMFSVHKHTSLWLGTYSWFFRPVQTNISSIISTTFCLTWYQHISIQSVWSKPGNQQPTLAWNSVWHSRFLRLHSIEALFPFGNPCSSSYFSPWIGECATPAGFPCSGLPSLGQPSPAAPIHALGRIPLKRQVSNIHGNWGCHSSVDQTVPQGISSAFSNVIYRNRIVIFSHRSLSLPTFRADGRLFPSTWLFCACHRTK
ncbi:hypothetical protein GE21DRAFT_1005337 [Neurospora crassa]|nr:hypothetical protein GE21DRAFT_1005337 [Neurospora crassa]